MDPSSHPPFKGSLLAAGLSSRLSHHITPSSSPQGLSLTACLGSSSPAGAARRSRARMASLGQLVLVAGLAFLMLAAQDHVKHGPAEAAAGLLITAAAAAPAPPPEVINPPVQPLSLEEAEAGQRPPIPPSGPSDQFNDKVNGEKPSSGRTDGGRRLGAP